MRAAAAAPIGVPLATLDPSKSYVTGAIGNFSRLSAVTTK
jgi:hypothetical protein